MTDRSFSVREPISDARARFDALSNYEVTVCSTPSRGDAVEMRFRFAKPGFVRMDFIRPYPGVVLAYNPETDEALLWPFGFRTFPLLTLAPGNPLIRGPSGHRIDRCDLGALLANVRDLQCVGVTEFAGQEAVGSRLAARVVVTGAPGCDASGVGRYQLWLDLATGLPVKVISADRQGDLIETVTMDDLRVDVPEIEPFL